MRNIARLALSAALALGCTSLAHAQAPAADRDYSVSKPEREALQALQTAVTARDVAGARSAYSTAQSVAQGSDGRYLAGALLFRLGVQSDARLLRVEFLSLSFFPCRTHIRVGPIVNHFLLCRTLRDKLIHRALNVALVFGKEKLA